MPLYSRYRRRFRYSRYRKYRRYYRRYKKYFGTSRYINGTSRSLVKLKVPIHRTTTLTIPANQNESNVEPLCLPFTRSGFAVSALSSELYRAYASLYEQVRCIGVKVRISLITQIPTAAIPSLRIITGWDRYQHHGEAQPTAAELMNSAACNVFTAVNNGVAKVERACFAKDTQERCMWHDCHLVWNDADYAQNQWADPAYQKLYQSVYFFCPALFLCASNTVKNTVSGTDLSFYIDVQYYFQFRGPKFSSSFGAGGGGAQLAIAEPRVPVGGDIMDDGGAADNPNVTRAVVRSRGTVLPGIVQLPPDDPDDWNDAETDGFVNLDPDQSPATACVAGVCEVPDDVVQDLPPPPLKVAKRAAVIAGKERLQKNA